MMKITLPAVVTKIYINSMTEVSPSDTELPGNNVKKKLTVNFQQAPLGVSHAFWVIFRGRVVNPGFPIGLSSTDGARDAPRRAGCINRGKCASSLPIMLPWQDLSAVARWHPLPPFPSLGLLIAPSIRFGSVECVGNPPAWRSSNRSPPPLIPPPASLPASTLGSTDWPVSWASDPPSSAPWSSGTAGTIVEGEANGTILIRSRAPNPTPPSLPPQMRDSLRSTGNRLRSLTP